MHYGFLRKLSSLHAKARHVAHDFYRLQGFVPDSLYDIIKGSESFEAFLKYNPDQPRVPAGSSDGGAVDKWGR